MSYKVNVDVSVFKGAQTFSIGLILHNHTRAFIEDKNLRMAGSISVFESELIRVVRRYPGSWLNQLLRPSRLTRSNRSKI